MKSWYKYGVESGRRGHLRLGIDDSFRDHEESMTGYGADEGYNSREDFFARYLHGFHFGRLENYCDFIEGRIVSADRIYSIASGRAAVEMYFSEKGYDVTCSELERPACHDFTEKLFPKFQFVRHDILERPADKRYDALLCLSLIYLFDAKKMASFFENSAMSLRSGGRLILDSAGAPDNWLAGTLHEGLLRCEAMAKYSIRKVKGDEVAFVEKHFGFRHGDREIIELARRAGFRLCAQKDYAFLTDFRRSALFHRIINPDPRSVTGRFFTALGKKIPYTRMFEFQLEDETAPPR